MTAKRSALRLSLLPAHLRSADRIRAATVLPAGERFWIRRFARGGAVAGAAVTVDGVAVIADLHIAEDLTVTAVRSCARNLLTGRIADGAALKAVSTHLEVLVAIVASLNTSLYKLVAATSDRAVIQTGIGLDLVAVITNLQPLSHNPITAALNRAIIATAVRIHTVAVIAGFDSILNKPVTTRS